MKTEENNEDPPIPASIFDDERIDIQEKLSWLSIAKTWRLELRWKTPDFAALENLLITRYHVFVDDVPHADPFIGI